MEGAGAQDGRGQQGLQSLRALNPEILILRDPRESARKCSLSALRGMPGIRFVRYSPGLQLEVGRRLLLDADGEELTSADRGLPLLVLDCAWKHLPKLRAAVRGELVPRRLPPLATAYPRRSRVFVDPERGLASIEALYAALALLGDKRPELLAGYHWAGEFLWLNARFGL